MSNAQHTPGPWIWRKHSPVGGDCDLFFVGRGTLDKTTGNELVAEVLTDDPWANARLIAAAPELLEACQGLMWRFDVDDSDPHEPNETAPDIQIARAAIAKATDNT